MEPLWSPCEALVKPLWSPCEALVKPLWSPCGAIGTVDINWDRETIYAGFLCVNRLVIMLPNLLLIACIIGPALAVVFPPSVEKFLAEPDDNSESDAKLWVLIVAGSNGFYNYRHQVSCYHTFLASNCFFHWFRVTLNFYRSELSIFFPGEMFFTGFLCFLCFLWFLMFFMVFYGFLRFLMGFLWFCVGGRVPRLSDHEAPWSAGQSDCGHAVRWHCQWSRVSDIFSTLLSSGENKAQLNVAEIRHRVLSLTIPMALMSTRYWLMQSIKYISMSTTVDVLWPSGTDLRHLGCGFLWFCFTSYCTAEAV